MLDTEGALSCEQIPSVISLSRISQANMFGLSTLYMVIDSMTVDVATLGLEPPIKPGFMEPVELNLNLNILINKYFCPNFYFTKILLC